ncbi:MAG: DoxX family protein [Cyclobacteriaceae bacterium]|nr:DoxX family protein [Cyclobacteriaceae bacterium]
MKPVTNLIARILFVIPLVAFGLGHFVNANEMAQNRIPDLPGGIMFVYLTGAALIAAAVSILLKKKAALATLLLGVILLLFALMVHLPFLMSEDPVVAMSGRTNFLKDIGLAGAAWFMSGVYYKEEV